jgi:hypothetical protein
MGIGLRTVPLSTFNMIFIVFIVAGFFIAALLWKRQEKVDTAALEEFERKKSEAFPDSEDAIVTPDFTE